MTFTLHVLPCLSVASSTGAALLEKYIIMTIPASTVTAIGLRARMLDRSIFPSTYGVKIQC